jgi:hypothetical protein
MGRERKCRNSIQTNRASIPKAFCKLAHRAVLRLVRTLSSAGVFDNAGDIIEYQMAAITTIGRDYNDRTGKRGALSLRFGRANIGQADIGQADTQYGYSDANAKCAKAP